MNYQTKIIKYKLLLVLTFFFLLRIIYAYFSSYQEIPAQGDVVTYNEYALAILNKADWLANPDFLGHYRPPVYPMFLAIIYSIFGAENLFAVYFFQAIISTLTVYYIFKLSSSIFDEKKSFLSLFWAGFYCFYLWYAKLIIRETLIIFLIIFSFYHLWIFLKNKEKTHYLKSIDLWKFMIAFTILLHTDARYLFYIPFISILFVIYKNIWVGVKQYSCVLGIFILLLIPWSIRNYIAYDGFVLINTRTIDARQENISVRLEILSGGEATQLINKNYPSEEERTLIKKGKNPNNRSRDEINIIKKDVYAPTTFIWKRLYRFKEMWIPFRFWSDYEPFPEAKFKGPWSLKHNLGSIVFYGILIPFVFYNVFYLFKKREKEIYFLIFPIVIHTLLHFLMWGKERYRLPIDAFIIILGCYGIIIFTENLKKIKKRFFSRYSP